MHGTDPRELLYPGLSVHATCTSLIHALSVRGKDKIALMFAIIASAGRGWSLYTLQGGRGDGILFGLRSLQANSCGAK